jgi:hypothetical protein
VVLKFVSVAVGEAKLVLDTLGTLLSLPVIGMVLPANVVFIVFVGGGIVLVGIVLVGIVLVGKLLAGKLLAGKLLAGKLLAGKLLAGKLLVGKLLVGKLLVGKLLVGKLLAGKLLAGILLVGILLVGILLVEVLVGIALVSDDRAFGIVLAIGVVPLLISGKDLIGALLEDKGMSVIGTLLAASGVP